MQTVANPIISHVRKSVVNHAFADPSDWANGLLELASMSDGDIEAVVSFRPFLFPLPIGVTPEMARKDRELYDRVVRELTINS